MSNLASPVEQYRRLFSRALQARLPVDEFHRFFDQLLARSPLPSPIIVSELLCTALAPGLPDPLHLKYVQHLVEIDSISLAAVLTTLFAAATKSTSSTATPRDAKLSQNDTTNNLHRESLEQDIFLILANVLRTHKPRSSDNVWAAVQALSDWMEALMAASGNGILEPTSTEVTDISTVTREQQGRIEALAEMLVALSQNDDAVRILGEGGRKEKKLVFQTSLALFTQYIAVQNPVLAGRLEFLRILQMTLSPPKKRKDKTRDMIDGMMIRLDQGVQDSGSQVWSRAGLFVWLNSLFASCPHLEEDLLLSYLRTRYKGNVSALIESFVIAMLDCLTNALQIHTSPTHLLLLRHTLTNKLPPLLARVSPNTLTAHLAISQAFMRTDLSSITSLSPTLFDPNSSATSQDHTSDPFSFDLRQEFLFSCALHGVIAESDIQSILGELPLGALPNSGRYTHHALVSEAQIDPSRIDRLLEELDAFDGNTAAVAQALIVIIRAMCLERETLPLRSICAHLLKRPTSLDVLMLFIRPERLLAPLTTLLESWRYEEDQGEFQPVYEEFGFILLLCLTITVRYSLRPTSPFLSEIFKIQLPSADLSPQRDGWIKELFEGEGISDGLMASCRPQDFYSLVPGLIEQSLLAVERGVLDLETLKESFAFLLEPFLLPSLFGGLGWLANYIWAAPSGTPVALQMLCVLILPSSISGEAREVHRTVTALHSRRLVQALNKMPRQVLGPLTTKVDALLAFLQPLQNLHPSTTPEESDLRAWCRAPLATAVTNSFACLTNWSTAPIPRPYHPKLFITAWSILGARNFIRLLLSQTAPHDSTAEDVCVNTVLSYIHTPLGERTSPLQALQDVEQESSFKEDGPTLEVARRVRLLCEAQGMHYEPIDELVVVGGEGLDAAMEGIVQAQIGGVEMEMGIGMDMEIEGGMEMKEETTPEMVGMEGLEAMLEEGGFGGEFDIDISL